MSDRLLRLAFAASCRASASGRSCSGWRARNTLTGWVLNGDDGVEIHVEGAERALETFLRDSRESSRPPPRSPPSTSAALSRPASRLHDSREPTRGAATARIAPDLPSAMSASPSCSIRTIRRYRYPYINCTNCGPRYSVILRPALRPAEHDDAATGRSTTCARREYRDPDDRRFHAQPVACPTCGPRYHLCSSGDERRRRRARPASARAAELLRAGAIVAVKGIGGYHLACDARNAAAVAALARAKVSQGKAVRADGAATSTGARAVVELSPRPRRC